MLFFETGDRLFIFHTHINIIIIGPKTNVRTIPGLVLAQDHIGTGGTVPGMMWYQWLHKAVPIKATIEEARCPSPKRVLISSSPLTSNNIHTFPFVRLLLNIESPHLSSIVNIINLSLPSIIGIGASWAICSGLHARNMRAVILSSLMCILSLTLTAGLLKNYPMNMRLRRRCAHLNMTRPKEHLAKATLFLVNTSNTAWLYAVKTESGMLIEAWTLIQRGLVQRWIALVKARSCELSMRSLLSHRERLQSKNDVNKMRRSLLFPRYRVASSPFIKEFTWSRCFQKNPRSRNMYWLSESYLSISPFNSQESTWRMKPRSKRAT